MPDSEQGSAGLIAAYQPDPTRITALPKPPEFEAIAEWVSEWTDPDDDVAMGAVAIAIQTHEVALQLHDLVTAVRELVQCLKGQQP